MRIEAHFEKDGFSALKPEWNDLLHRSCCDTLFLTWEWQVTWWEHLGQGRLVLLGFRHEEDGRLVGIAPLFVCQQGDRLGLNVIGCRDVSDYLDLIIEAGQEEAVYQALLDYLESAGLDWECFDLCNIPQESLTHTRLREIAEERGYQALVEVEDVCPIIELPATWDEYLDMLDKKQRHEIRRKLRKAEGGAQAEFSVVGPEDDLRVAMADFITLHQKSAPHKDAFMDPEMQGFFYAVAQALHNQGWLQLCFVEIQGVKSASLLNFDYGNAILVYNSGYDPMRFRHLSPGIVVSARAIELAISLGREKFDFLRGDEVYKYRFGAEDRVVRRLFLCKPGVQMAGTC